MKITISSPDGLGDFILRVPMIRALLDDGHELQIFLRHPAAGLAAEIFPGVERHVIEADPYHPDTRRRRNPFRAEQAAIRKFSPDLYVAPLFALNFFDEVWFESDKWRVPVAGLATSESFCPSGTIADPRELAARFRIRVEVPVALPELEKNRLLGSSVIGRVLPVVVPQLEAGAAAIDAARNILRRHGLQEGEYWIACVGGRSGLRMKDWGEENWREFFSAALPGDGRPVVFLGNTKEWESIERIRSDRYRSINLASEPPPIPVSLALASMSCGYVGRDSGVMHMTCAVRRPVLAAFGGGHWGRFLPARSAVVATVSVICRGCDSACPHDRPHCVSDIELSTMLRAWQRFLEIGEEVEILEQPCTTGVGESLPWLPVDFALKARQKARGNEAAARASVFRRLFSRKQ